MPGNNILGALLGVGRDRSKLSALLFPLDKSQGHARTTAPTRDLERQQAQHDNWRCYYCAHNTLPDLLEHGNVATCKLSTCNRTLKTYRQPNFAPIMHLSGLQLQLVQADLRSEPDAHSLLVVYISW